MRNVVLYIAMSLDGYIADRSGGVDWLHGQSGDVPDLDTYPAFIEGVDTVVMGWRTYHQIVTELSPGEWVYQGLTAYVLTHRSLPAEKGIIFTPKDPRVLIAALREEPGKGIWICGGADVVRQVMAADLVDEYRISVIPTVLGGGVRLFGETGEVKPLRLVRTQAGNGIVELTYLRGR